MALRSALMNVMTAAAEKAARTMKRDFGEVEQLQVSNKGPSDFVTAADVRAERILRAELSKARPKFGFLMEESGETKGEDDRYRWIIDPVDGTTNFVHGIPHFAISIALEYAGEIVAGLILNPITDELFTAEKGKGVSLNAHRLRVSSRGDLTEAVIGTGIPHRGRGDHGTYLKTLGRVMEQVAGIRRMGSAALDLAYVAAGRYDGYWETGLQPWDVAAGVLMVKEAGGFVTEVNGGKDPVGTGSILAANARLHKPLQDLLLPA